MRDPHFQSERVTLYHGDCLEVMRELPDESVHAVVTDPPYGLGFMGRAWDALPPGEEFAREALRVLKPGGHIVAFGGSRTWHRLAVAIEDAGFEIRDSIAWLYGSGFPKSMDVSKAVEAHVTVGGSNSRRLREIELAGDGEAYSLTGKNNGIMGETVTVERKTFEAGTDEAKTWKGWGTALKPAFEPIVVGRKPLAGTVAANVLAHGTGALNIDATRIGIDESERSIIDSRRGASAKHEGHYTVGGHLDRAEGERFTSHASGRWPTNVVLDGSQAEVLDEQSGHQRDGTAVNRNKDTTATKPANVYGAYKNGERPDQTYGGAGGASRFFPVFRFEAKAPRSERPNVDGVQHPTVKPLALMRWLCRLVTPRGGVILEPFAGSGTTLEAAILEGFDVIGIEREADYLPLIMSRVRKDHEVVMDLWGGEAA